MRGGRLQGRPPPQPPPCGPLRSKNMGRTSNWECAMIWYLVSHIETLQNTISSRTFLYNVSPTIDSYEALYSIISHIIRTHRSSHNETRNIRHFTHPQSDVSTLFSSVPWKGGAGGKPGLAQLRCFSPCYLLHRKLRLFFSHKVAILLQIFYNIRRNSKPVHMEVTNYAK